MINTNYGYIGKLLIRSKKGNAGMSDELFPSEIEGLMPQSKSNAPYTSAL